MIEIINSKYSHSSVQSVSGGDLEQTRAGLALHKLFHHKIPSNMFEYVIYNIFKYIVSKIFKEIIYNISKYANFHRSNSGGVTWSKLEMACLSINNVLLISSRPFLNWKLFYFTNSYRWVLGMSYASSRCPVLVSEGQFGKQKTRIFNLILGWDVFFQASIPLPIDIDTLIRLNWDSR